jgi:hypothetical protein
MANIKISQLPAKGANLASTDLVEISEFTGTGYISKSITGQEIYDGIPPASAEWGNITGALPSQTDLQDALNLKQDVLTSGTNIKTINGSSVLGSGDLTISSGTGLKGIHGLVPMSINDAINTAVDASTLNVPLTLINNRMYAYPFIPNQTFTSGNIYINVTTASAGALGRVLVYSNLNGLPYQKLYESPSLDLSTTGQKTLSLTNLLFNEGVIYWLTFQSQGTAAVTSIPNSSALLLKVNGLTSYTHYTGTAAIGSAPSIFSVGITGSGGYPMIGIFKLS